MISLQSGFPFTLTITMCLLGEHLGKNWDALTHSPLSLLDFFEWIMLILVLFGFFVCLFFLMKKSRVPVREVSFQ